MNKRTTIHKDNHSGNLHVDYEPSSSAVFLQMDSGGFSHCLSLTAFESRLMAEALLKGAYAIEAALPSAA